MTIWRSSPLGSKRREKDRECVLKTKASILIIALERKTQTQVDTWAEFVLGNYEADPDVSYFEIPMIAGTYKFMSGVIDGGMRSGIDLNLHDNVATFYGNRKPYIEQLGIKDKSDCYVFLLDGDGIIRFHASGAMSEEGKVGLAKALELLVK